MFESHPSGRATAPHETAGMEPPIDRGELFGALQLLFGMMQSGERPVIVMVAGVSGAEGASTVATSLARSVHAETGLRACIIARQPGGVVLTEMPGGAPAPSGGTRGPGGPSGRIGDWGDAASEAFGRSAEPRAPAGGLREDLRGLPGDIDLILVDSAPILTSLEGASLSAQVDGVLMVVESGRTGIAEAAAARTAIERAGGRVLGVIVNKRRFPMPAMFSPLLRLLGLGALAAPRRAREAATETTGTDRNAAEPE